MVSSLKDRISCMKKSWILVPPFSEYHEWYVMLDFSCVFGILQCLIPLTKSINKIKIENLGQFVVINV